MSRTILAALVTFACSSSSIDVDATWSCADGVLDVAGPVSAIDARYEVAPGAVTGFRCDPSCFVTADGDGWNSITLYEPTASGEAATIEAHDAATGEPLCPTEVQVSR